MDAYRVALLVCTPMVVALLIGTSAWIFVSFHGGIRR